MDVVREIMEFYYRKGVRGLQVGSLMGGMKVPCAEKREGFYFRSFFILSLTCKWGENLHHCHL
jgi:hypothetical protein